VADTEAEVPDAEEAVEAPPAERHGVRVVAVRGVDVLFPPADEYLRVVEALRDEGYDLCSDLTAVDYLTHPGRSLPEGVAGERYEVVVNLLSLERRERVRIRVQVPQADPVVPSLFALHPGTEAPEREVYDMFGIAFDGHPDLTRILMPEDWEGHPLRKDFAVGRIPVQFKAVGGGR
jgi:NADH-quinone oxidoreductase subunit C